MLYEDNFAIKVRLLNLLLDLGKVNSLAKIAPIHTLELGAFAASDVGLFVM